MREILYGKLKSWEQVCADSEEVIKSGGDKYEVWHPADKYLNVNIYSIENIFGQDVRMVVKFTKTDRIIYDVGREVIESFYGATNYSVLKKEMTAYDYWFEYVTKEKPQQLPDHLFEI